jgi:hypothetical protein
MHALRRLPLGLLDAGPLLFLAYAVQGDLELLER